MKYSFVYCEEHGDAERCCPPELPPELEVVPYVYLTLEESARNRGLTMKEVYDVAR